MAAASNAIPAWYLVFQMSMIAMEQENKFQGKSKKQKRCKGVEFS
jgi:hypothetical protein